MPEGTTLSFYTPHATGLDDGVANTIEAGANYTPKSVFNPVSRCLVS